MMALLVRSPHCGRMAKTWVPKDSSKSQKAFEKAMRALVSPKGRRNQMSTRPR
jgi:hypothetical protein